MKFFGEKYAFVTKDPSFIRHEPSPSKTITTVIQAITAMLNTQGKYFNPTDVFNKKAALETMKEPKTFEIKEKYLVKKYANKKW